MTKKAIRRKLKMVLSLSTALLLLLQLSIIPSDIIDPTPPEDDGVVTEDDTIITPPSEGDTKTEPYDDGPGKESRD